MLYVLPAMGPGSCQHGQIGPPEWKDALYERPLTRVSASESHDSKNNHCTPFVLAADVFDGCIRLDLGGARRGTVLTYDRVS